MMRATSKLWLPLCVVLAGVCLAASAQSSFQKLPAQAAPSSQQKLIAIKVTGSKRFPEAAIAAATGLQMGKAVDDDEFKKAARRLGDTGVFTEIGYTFSFSSAGTKVEF